MGNFRDNTISKHEMTLKSYQKMQLWTNSGRSEYAIYLKNKSNKSISNTFGSSNNLLVATNYSRKIKYNELLDESDYIEDVEEYDWKYTLQQWIDNYNNGLATTTEPLSSSPSSLSPILSDFGNSLTEQQQADDETDSTTRNNNNEELDEKKSASNTITIRRNFGLFRVRAGNKKKTNLKKCRFCKLEYLTNKERLEHEQAWHISSIPN